MPFQKMPVADAIDQPDPSVNSEPSPPPLPEGATDRPGGVPVRSVCRIVRQMTSEMVMIAGDRVQLRRDRRRTNCHIRQIAMYVCHVSLRVSLSDIGQSFGRDRTTVGYACGVVEDRRDDPAFDEFVAAIERLATSVFSLGVADHE